MAKFPMLLVQILEGIPDDLLMWVGIIVGGLILLIFLVLEIIAMWKIFVKAGEPCWAILIPFYNAYVVLKIVGLKWWWLLLMLIPPIGAFISFVILYELARSFGKGVAFALGLFYLTPIFIIILGFGKVPYIGPAAAR